MTKRKLDRRKEGKEWREKERERKGGRKGTTNIIECPNL